MATTIVNTPPAQESGGNGMGFLIGIVILVVFGLIVYFYALPYIRQMMNGNIDVTIPAEINVPSDVNVTIENPE